MDEEEKKEWRGSNRKNTLRVRQKERSKDQKEKGQRVEKTS